MFAPKNILVPTDFSEFSDNALEKAYDIAKQYKAKIHLLHVIGVVQTCAVDYCFDQATIDDLDRKAAESSKEIMRKQIEKVVKSKDVEIAAYVTKGTPYEEILKEQQSRNIDLIVIASHGRTGILGHLIGSVAEKVVRAATCPVVLVKNR
ncbi:MAG TPA: universal stress protein [Syntrophorhabdaceae bacterium]|nr:universal stress protein [Syntrophorhabdaceae bacterium]